MKSHYYKTCKAILLAAGILAAPAAFANSVQFDFIPSGGGGSLLTAVFQDVGANQLQLTVSATGLAGNDTINSLCFNFNPVFNSKDLSFNEANSVGGVLGAASSANDSYKISGGSGKFDVQFLFDPGFKNGNTVTYSITGIPGLSVNDFLYLETASAGRVPGYAAAAIKQDSGLLIVQGSLQSVPDASSTFGLLALALVTVGFLGRRLQAAKSV